MRASSPAFRACAGAFALTALCGLVACDKGEPDPQKVERVSPFERGNAKRPPRDPNTPLRNPATEAPRGPDGEQVSKAEIEAALTEAAKQKEVGNVVAQRNALRACANKTPPNARCDAEMGLSQITARNRRAAALYYLALAANNDDPELGAEVYAAVGEALSKHGRKDDAIAALRLAVARGEAAEHLYLLGRTLSLQHEHVPEAIDMLAAARAKDDRLEWLYEQAVLCGQFVVRERAEAAVELFGTYLERAKALPEGTQLPAPLERVEARRAELGRLAPTYPTQAEVDERQAALAAAQADKPPEAPEPQ